MGFLHLKWKKAISNAENQFRDLGNYEESSILELIPYQSLRETPFITAESTFQKGFRKKL